MEIVEEGGGDSLVAFVIDCSQPAMIGAAHGDSHAGPQPTRRPLQHGILLGRYGGLPSQRYVG